jgi:hypothetical protein
MIDNIENDHFDALDEQAQKTDTSFRHIDTKNNRVQPRRTIDDVRGRTPRRDLGALRRLRAACRLSRVETIEHLYQ